MSPLGLAARSRRRDLRRYRDLVLQDGPLHYFRCDKAPLATSGVGAQDDIPGAVNLGTSVGVWRAGTNIASGQNFGLVTPGGVKAEPWDGCFEAPGTPNSRYIVPFPGGTPFNIATAVTMECMVYLPVAQAAGHMMWATSHGSDGRPYSYILRNSTPTSQIAFAPRGNAGGAGSVCTWTLAGGAITLATWHHVAITWAGATREARLYFNGASQGAITSTTDIIATPQFGPIFGVWYWGGANFTWPMTNGARFDEVAIYPYILSGTRIAAHANRALAASS